MRMSPGAGLRPSPPPLLRTQAPLPPRVRHPGGFGTGSYYPQAEPQRRWQAFGQSKGGGDRRRRTTGDICPDACHLRCGPDLRGGSCRRRRRGRALEGAGACVRMSPGAGLRPSPPPLLRTQASLPPRVRHPGGFGTGSYYPQAEPLRGWQAFGQSKGGGGRHRRATGDICPNACHPRCGPNARNESDRGSTKNPGKCRGFSFGTAQAPYFFFGMYRSVIVPS
ncbi:hypothetical protein STENO_000489 [Stenotrophomonas maltophilia]